MTFSQNWEIRLVFTKSPHHGWQFFLVTTQRMLENAILEKKQGMTLNNTHKSPLRNAFFFVYHKLGWDMD